MEKYSKNNYKLIDGRIEDIEIKALNCINSIYSSNYVTGVMKNPTAQVAAWSFLKFTLGEKLRNLILENTKIKADSIILEDDELTTTEPSKTHATFSILGSKDICYM